MIHLIKKNTDLYKFVYSESFSYSDDIWKNSTLPLSESKCLQTSIVGNIITTNGDYKFINDKNINNDKVSISDFEDGNKFNDKENIILEDYKGGIFAEREWFDFGKDKYYILEKYGNNDYFGSSSQTKSLPKSLFQKDKKKSNSIVKNNMYQHIRYPLQEISFNSLPEYQMNSIYFNNNSCDTQYMIKANKCRSLQN